MQERNLKILRAMVAHDENRFCFDCHQRGPTYVNITIGSFVCTSCGGALRKYNHRVKSISMSNFSPSEIDFLRKRGNKACRKIYLALSDDQVLAEKELGDAARDEHLRQKYQMQKWYREPTADLDTEAIQENQQIMDRVDQGGSQPKYSRNQPTNAAAGLLLPSRQNSVSSNSIASTSSSASQVPPVPTNGLQTHPPPLSPPTSDPFSAIQLETPRPRLLAPPSKATNKPEDPFSAFGVSSPPTGVKNTQENFFADFSWNAAPPLSSQTAAVPPKQSSESASTAVSNPWSSANFESKGLSSGFTPAVQTTATGDKYAALAELDGIFKSSGTAGAPVRQEPTTDFRFPSHSAPIVSSALPFSSSSAFPTNTFAATQPIQQPANPFISPVAKVPTVPRQYSASNPFTSPAPPTQPPFGPPFATVPISAPPPSVFPPAPRNPFYSEQQLHTPWPNNSANPFSSTGMSAGVSGLSNGKSNLQWPSQSSGVFSLSDSSSTNGLFPATNAENARPKPQVAADQAFSDFAAFGR